MRTSEIGRTAAFEHLTNGLVGERAEVVRGQGRRGGSRTHDRVDRPGSVVLPIFIIPVGRVPVAWQRWWRRSACCSWDRGDKPQFALTNAGLRLLSYAERLMTLQQHLGRHLRCYLPKEFATAGRNLRWRKGGRPLQTARTVQAWAKPLDAWLPVDVAF